jgi:hypothetical protein
MYIIRNLSSEANGQINTLVFHYRTENDTEPKTSAMGSSCSNQEWGFNFSWWPDTLETKLLYLKIIKQFSGTLLAQHSTLHIYEDVFVETTVLE